MTDYNITKLKPSEDHVENLFDVRFKSTPNHPLIDKAQAVAQAFLKVLLTTPGTDPFNTDLGAGLGNFLRYNSDVKDPFFESEVQRMVNEANRQEIVFQSEELDLPDSERLLSATLVEILLEEGTNNVFISIRLKTVAGNILDIDVPPPSPQYYWPS